MENTIIGELQSDYDPDTFMRIVITEGGDISVGIYGGGEFIIAGHHGGSQLQGKHKTEIVKSFNHLAKAFGRLKESQPIKSNIDYNELYIRIGRMICYYRKEKKLTQEQLSQMIGIDRCTLTLYENGKIKISLPKLYMIADVLGESIYSFLPDPKEIRSIK